MHIKSSSKLPVGKIVYHVYGVDRTGTTDQNAEITKMVILSKPKMVKLGTCGGKFEGWDSPFIEVQVHFDNHSYTSNRSLHDMGVDLGIRNAYNLNRIFHTYEDAELFIEELKADKFSDPVNQEYADRFPAEEALAEREYDMTFDFEDGC